MVAPPVSSMESGIGSSVYGRHRMMVFSHSAPLNELRASCFLARLAYMLIFFMGAP